MSATDKLPREIMSGDRKYELFIRKEFMFGKDVWTVEYATTRYYSDSEEIPAEELLYGFTGTGDLEDTAQSTLVRLKQKKLYA